MHRPQTRVLHQTNDRRDDLMAVVQSVLPQTARGVEAAGMYLALVALWALILYLAIGVLAS